MFSQPVDLLYSDSNQIGGCPLPVIEAMKRLVREG
jgi:hypothetical protein